ncbi:MAG: hypothetical protein ACYTHM_16910 [Planctomycetota bacterium]
MKFAGTRIGVALVFALVFAPAALGGEKGEEKEPPKKKQEDPKPPAPKNDPKALEIFDKAVAWQGKPTTAGGKLLDLEVNQLNFKLWGDHEVEGKFEFKYTAPNKVWFMVWTKTWWRKYWTNGEDCYWKKADTKGGCEWLDPKDKDQKEAIGLIREAVRIARLVVLRNHKSGDVVFKYDGLATPLGKKDAAECHFVKRLPQEGKGDDKDFLYFFLSKEDFRPLCIGVREFLNIRGTFLIHLSQFQPFNGVQFPRRIEIFAHKGEDDFQKFLFADVVVDPENALKVRVNGGIDDEIYEFQKD